MQRRTPSAPRRCPAASFGAWQLSAWLSAGTACSQAADHVAKAVIGGRLSQVRHRGLEPALGEEPTAARVTRQRRRSAGAGGGGLQLPQRSRLRDQARPSASLPPRPSPVLRPGKLQAGGRRAPCCHAPMGVASPATLLCLRTSARSAPREKQLRSPELSLPEPGSGGPRREGGSRRGGG